MSIWEKSGFLDLTASGLSDAATPEAAYGITDPGSCKYSITIGLILPRLEDPTALLSSSYAAREAVLNGLTADQVGARFGADPALFNQIETYLAGVTGVHLASSSELVSSAASRTIWITVTSNGFNTLFGQPLMSSTKVPAYWDGTLTPNAELSSLVGLMPLVYGSGLQPTVQNSTAVTLTDGPQGVANTAGGGYDKTSNPVATEYLSPSDIATAYHFPVQSTGSTTLATPAIGLLEPGCGDAVPAGNVNTLIQNYRASIGISGTGTISEGRTEATPTHASNGERSLDVGVVAAAAPNSSMITYSGVELYPYTAMQEAIWGNDPKIAALSNSFGFLMRPASGSPFQAALQGLYEDAALNNISVFMPATDGGSSAEDATGVPQISSALDSLWATVVGGTSTSSQAQVAAAGAATPRNINTDVATILKGAIAGDLASLKALVAGGLLKLPKADGNVEWLLQTAWNQYRYQASTHTLTASYAENEATGGGVDTDIAEPAYQRNAGIDTQALQVADGLTPAAVAGRGVPDVSALAGGNAFYTVPDAGMAGVTYSGGTSAATPLWAALTAQIQAVFTDQGLPALGTFNDLLYQVAAVEPAAFNDVQFGSNTSSFYVDPNGSVTAVTGYDSNWKPIKETITPTGQGYSAHPGYDLVSGLGTPNGTLLARALTQIAHAQIYSAAPGLTDSTGGTAAAGGVVLVQSRLAAAGTVSVAGQSLASDASSPYGWTSQLAQQSLQPDFDPALVTLFDGDAQGATTQVAVSGGQMLGVSIDGVAAITAQSTLTSPFGFVTYGDAAGNSVTLARPVAIAQTAGGANDQQAVVRIRQDDTATQTLGFYRVDDLSGDIGGLAPGQAGYAQAAASRAYRTVDGHTDIVGQGHGRESTATLTGINAGDIVASVLSSQGHQTWAFSNGNESVGGAPVNHIYSYGLNTWGYEDTYGGGDHDFNDLVFQLDFTSASGHGYLAGTDLTSPHVASITAVPDVPSGPLGLGHTLTFTLRANTALSVTAAADGSLPTLALDNGGSAILNAAASSGDTLVFNTTVEAGQRSPALTVAGLVLNGATIQSGASLHIADQSLVAVQGAQTGLAVAIEPETTSLFRFFDSSNGSHFYTASADERATILATRPDLVPEGQDGVGMQAVNPAAGDAYAAPVFRFFDTMHGTQFLTTSVAERDSIVAGRPDLTFEPTDSFYMHTQAQAGDTAVYRFFSSTDGTHFYTDSATERASVLQSRPDLVAEGIGFYEPGRAGV